VHQPSHFPRFVNSYYWTIDVADTLAGPDAVSSSPIYEGAHYFRKHTSTGVVHQIYYFVSGSHCTFNIFAVVSTTLLHHLPTPSFLITMYLYLLGFQMTYYSFNKLVPSQVVVNIDGIEFFMKDPTAWKQDPRNQGLGIGTPDKGLYVYVEDISGRLSTAFPGKCRAYHFQVTNTDGIFRLPEIGYYSTCDYQLKDLRTTEVSLYANHPPSCADNWVDSQPPPAKQIPAFPQLPDEVDGQLYSMELGQSGPWGAINLQPAGDSALAVRVSPSNPGTGNTLHYFESLSSEILNSYSFGRFNNKTFVSDLNGDRVVGGYAEWSGVSSSSDGSKLVAIQSGIYSSPGETPRLYQRGYIYRSLDFGHTWIRVNVTGDWSDVCSSADGSFVVAVERGDITLPNTVGSIMRSTDFGQSWTRQVSSIRGWARGTEVYKAGLGAKVVVAAVVVLAVVVK